MKKILILISVVVLVGAIGATSAMAASGGFFKERPELTDEQKVEMQSKMKDRLAQDLADGKITQEQYDAIINGEIPPMGNGHGRGGKGFPGGMGNPGGRPGFSTNGA